MRKVFFPYLLLSFIVIGSHAQVSLTNGSPSVLIDFSNTTPATAGSNPPSAYTAAGFQPNTTSAGMLNSNAWAVTGWSDGNLAFGGTRTTASTDYTRGQVSVAQTTGGFYAYTGAPASAANPTFMIQPGGSDFAPGTLTLRIQNNGTDAITQLSISYNIYVRNDEGRSNSFNFSYSTNDVSYTNISALDYTSPAAADALGWVLVGSSPSRSTVITGLNIAPGAFLYLRWSGADVPGTGSRDEFGLDDINISATFTPISTDYYRTVTSGNWNNIAVWETSPDNATWNTAVLPPTASANTISIRNGHTVTITSSISADQLIVEAGGMLTHTNGQMFTLSNASGSDMTVFGTYELNGTQPSGTGTIDIENGGVVKVNSNPSPNESDDFGFGNSNVTFHTGCIYEWATVNTPSWSNRVYFTPGQITTFKFTASPSGILGGGAGNTTTIHGILQADVNITIHNSADKTFVNGITGNGNISSDASFTGNIFITGSTAVLGGSGLLSLPVSPSSLRIGTNTIVSMTSDKTVNGNISILSNSYVNLGQYNLTNTGSISGGTTNYIRTDGTGSLILGNVTGLRNAPIGYISYNPLTITHNAGHNWSVRVEDAVQVLNPNPPFAGNVDGAVLREWHITPSVYPLAAGADIVFGYDDNPAASPRQTGTLFNTSSTVQVWHEVPSTMPWGFDWVAAGVTQVPTGSANGPRTASLTNWSLFSSFAVSTFLYPLPIKLTRFDAVKLNASRAMLSWELAACCSKEARFELEKSTDGRNYILLTTLAGSESSKQYSYTDNQLTAGTTWYRLKATDADGKITYSRVATIVNDDSGGLVVTLSPNPAGEQAVVSVTAAKKATVQFSIISSSGVVMKQWQQTVAAGTQTAAADMSALPAGIYQLLCQSEAEKVVVRFVKN